MATTQDFEPGALSAEQKALVEAARTFATARNRPSVIYMLANDQVIGTPNVRKVAEVIGGRQFEGGLDLVVHASGGDVHAAYQLVAFLRRRSDTLTACVPRYARSAATLLCVGAESICLDELAALGPLDAQLYQGLTDDGRPNYQSALNHFKSLERLQDFSLETLRGVSEMLYERDVRRTEDFLRYGIEFVRVTAAPLLEKIEAQRLGDYSQALAIGEQYGHRLLRGLPGVERERAVRALVYGYPSHEYVIDCEELQRLGLRAEVFGGDQREAARELANCQGELARREGNTAIMLMEPDGASAGEESRQVWFGREGRPIRNPWRKATLEVGSREERMTFNAPPPGPGQDITLEPWEVVPHSGP